MYIICIIPATPACDGRGSSDDVDGPGGARLLSLVMLHMLTVSESLSLLLLHVIVSKDERQCKRRKNASSTSLANSGVARGATGAMGSPNFW